MNPQHLSLHQIIHCIKEYHHIDDIEIQKIESAFELVKESVENKISFLNSNDLDKVSYNLNHSLAVAQYMASWRFDYTVVIAALLHALPINDIKSLEEIKSSIEEDIYLILKGYIEVHKQIIAFKAGRSVDVANINFINSPYPECFYIEIAVHVSILSLNMNSKEEGILVFAQETREFLIPQVKHIHAYWMVDLLENLCFKIENMVNYQRMSLIINQVYDLNGFYNLQFITKLYQIFDKNSNIIPQNLKGYQSLIKLFYASKRSIISVYRFITQSNDELHPKSTLLFDLDKLNNFARTALYDLTLVLDDEIGVLEKYTIIDVFFEYYQAMLQSENVFIYGCYQTTNEDSYYFLISDPMKNMYRFFVKTESQYLHYLYGDIIERDKFNLNYIARKNENKIKVFRRDGTAELVKKDITVLDFAFMIHEDLGLHFGSAILNQNDRSLPAHTLLNNGDTVEIKKSEKITAELIWFRYLKTELAINYLIKYFKALYKRSDSSIKIITKDGSIAQIQKGSTALDFAFMIHKDMGLRFDYALINDSKKHYPIDYILCDGDVVVIQVASSIRADYYWFRHINTMKAINYLVDYFKQTRKQE